MTESRRTGPRTYSRRRDDDSITIGELARRLDRHEQQSSEIHRDQLQMIRKLDSRTDRLTTRVTVVFSVVAVLWALFLVIAPVIRVLFFGQASG